MTSFPQNAPGIGGVLPLHLRASRGTPRLTAVLAIVLFGSWFWRTSIAGEIVPDELDVAQFAVRDLVPLPLQGIGGVLNPYKVIPIPHQPAAWILSGQGEYGGMGYLYLLDALQFRLKVPPLAVCINPGDSKLIGRWLLIACRGSDEIVTVDTDRWQVVDRQPTVSQPISLATWGRPDEVAVVGRRRAQLAVWRITATGNLVSQRVIELPEVPYTIVADSMARRAYLLNPRGNVAEFDTASDALLRRIEVGGEPSFGGLVVDDHLLYTDRNGFLGEVDLEKWQARRIPLAPLLGLEPAAIPLRGIEPMDVLQLGGNQIAVICNRQDGLILKRAGDGEWRIERTMPAGAYGAVVGDALWITRPQRNRIVEIPLQKNLPPKYHQTGISITATQRLDTPTGTVIFYVDSMGTLHRRASNGDTTLISPPAKFTWLIDVPLVTTGNPPRILLPAFDAEGHLAIVALRANGQMEATYTTSLPALGARLAATNDRALLINRLNGTGAIVDFANGSTTAFNFDHSRPRVAVLQPNANWQVFHDTNPDIGWSDGHLDILGNFTPLRSPGDIRGWPVDALALSNGVLAAGFDGGLAVFQKTQGRRLHISRRIRLPLTHIGSLARDRVDDKVWVSSKTDGRTPLLVLGNQPAINIIVALENVTQILPANTSTGRVLAVTDREMFWLPRSKTPN